MGYKTVSYVVIPDEEATSDNYSRRICTDMPINFTDIQHADLPEPEAGTFVGTGAIAWWREQVGNQRERRISILGVI